MSPFMVFPFSRKKTERGAGNSLEYLNSLFPGCETLDDFCFFSRLPMLYRYPKVICITFLSQKNNGKAYFVRI